MFDFGDIIILVSHQFSLWNEYRFVHIFPEINKCWLTSLIRYTFTKLKYSISISLETKQLFVELQLETSNGCFKERDLTYK